MSAATNLPTGRRGQALALAILLILLLAIWQGAVGPLLELYGDRADELEMSRQHVAMMTRLNEQLPGLKQKWEQGQRSGAPQKSLVIDGANDALAAASLQDQLRGMATNAGTTLVSVENLPPDTAPGAYHRIGLKISLNARWPVLVALLKAIEESSPPLLVDDVQIHGSPLPTLNQTRGLDASFAIYALRSGSAGERKP
jgi:general secretion pathway protein M